MTSVNDDLQTRDPVPDEEWAYGGKKAIVYFLLNYLETSRRIFDNESLPLKLKSRYINFKDNLQNESGTDVELIFTGSHAQSLLAFHWRYPPNTPLDMGRQAKSDIDVLLVDKSNSATQTYHSTERRYIMKDSYHRGYVMLFRGSTIISSKGFKKYWKNIIDRVEIHKRTGRGECFPARGDKSSGPALTRIENVGVRDFYNHDFVPAIRCDSWPSQAKEWNSRQRKSGWPSTHLIHQCMLSECHVVPVGHKMSPRYKKGKEWRLSFTCASLKLAHSLSLKQRQAFILCKLLIKETIAKRLINKPSLQHIKLISSYEIQTSFFWLCEEKMTWGNIFEDMSDIITKLLYFCRQKYLPDYFISDKNIFETISHQSLEICIHTIQSNLVDGNVLKILNNCFVSCYSDVIEYDLPKVQLIKTVMSEVTRFTETGMPSYRLYILCIIQMLFDALLAAFCNANNSDKYIEIDPIYVNLNLIQDLLLRRLQIDSFFDLGFIAELCQTRHLKSTSTHIPGECHDIPDVNISNIDSEEDTTASLQSFVGIVSDVLDDILNSLSMDFVFSYLEMDYWVVAVYLLGVHCINTGLAYQTRQEVIDLESLIEANTDKPHIVEKLISSYGTIEALKETSAKCQQEVAEWFELYVMFAQCGLGLYYHICERYSLDDVMTFSCRAEEIAVSCAKSFQRLIPEIFDDEMLGTPALRNRIQLLFNEKFDKLNL